MVTRSRYDKWTPGMQQRYVKRFGMKFNAAPVGAQPDPVGRAPSPGGTAPAAPVPLPDPIAIQRRAQASQRRDNLLADIGNDRTQFGQEYGITDTSNPFSRAALLQRNFQQQTRGNTNAYAARGQLYSGALQSQQDESRFGYTRDTDSLRRAFETGMAGFSRRERDIRSATDEELLDIAQDSTDRALANRPEAEGVPEFTDPLGESSEPSTGGKGVSWAVWKRWSPAQQKRYRARHRKNWSEFRPR